MKSAPGKMSWITDGLSLLTDGVNSASLSVVGADVRQLVVNLFYFGMVGIAIVATLLFILL